MNWHMLCTNRGERVPTQGRTRQQARDLDNRNYEVEWKYARMSYFLGSRKNTPEEESEKVLKKGLSAAKIAKRIEPNKPDGHFWYAAILYLTFGFEELMYSGPWFVFSIPILIHGILYIVFHYRFNSNVEEEDFLNQS